MHYPEMEKVARKLQSVGEAGYASPRCRLQPDSGRAAPTGTEKGRKASRQKTEPLAASLYLCLSLSPISVNAQLSDRHVVEGPEFFTKFPPPSSLASLSRMCVWKS